MSDSKGGRWEFDQDGNVHYVPPEEQNRSNSEERVDGTYRKSYQYHSADGHYNINIQKDSRRRKNNNDKGWHWLFIVLGFMMFWPIGLVLLFLEISGKWPGDKQVQREIDRAANVAKNAAAQAKTGYQQAQQNTKRQTARPAQSYQSAQTEKLGKKDRNQQRMEAKAHGFGNIRLLRVLGGILGGVFGFAFVMQLIDEVTYFFDLGYLLRQTLPLLALCLTGLALLGMAGSRTRKMKKFRKYLTMIGRKDEISISALAKAMGNSEKKTAQELEEMLERDYFDSGYIDAARNMLVLKEGGIPEEPEPQPQPQDVSNEQAESVADSTLKHIRQINDDIDNPELSRKIDRIEELTAKIFRLLEARPEKAGELKSFMNYYLPQTLKILENYAKLEEQDVDGENIRETKQKIEGMMDKIVDGYEAQLDKLFEDDALDISADLKVMESMLEKDGLTADNELRL